MIAEKEIYMFYHYNNKIMEYQPIDTKLVVTKRLHTGDQMPVIGLGTFGSDHVSNSDVAQAVKGAIRIGFRHIDCASVYGNEKEIGTAIKEIIDEGVVKREELWITSKVWNNMHSEGDVTKSCIQTLSDLQLDYLDLYIVHWPFPNFHTKGCDVSSRSLEAKPYIHESFMRTWREMESLVDKGLVRNIGTSNVTIPKLELILRDCRIKPAASEQEMHPHFQQKEMFSYLLSHDIQPIGFSPIGSPARPERDRTEDDSCDIEDAVILKIAERLGVHPAIVCIKWAVQRGQVPIPFSSNLKNIYANLKAVTENHITDQEMKEIETIDKNCRLIKGQVFLWKEGQSWEDLWDIDGEIAE